MGSRIAGLLLVGATVLAVVWAYNKFSGSNIGALGSGKTP